MSKRKFTAQEISDIVGEDVLNRKPGRIKNGLQRTKDVVEVEKKFYEVYWRKSLFDDIDSEFEDQKAPEVISIDKTIVVKKWIKL